METMISSTFETPALKALFNHPDVGIYTSARTGKFLKLNKKFCEIVGYEEQELIHMALTDIFFPENTDTAAKSDEALFTQGEESYSFEKRILRKDGSIRWLNFILSQICDSAGTACEYMGIVQDISVQKCKEEELYNTGRLLECIFDTTNAMIAYLDTDFNFIRVNRQYADAGGHPPEDYIGKNHFDLYPYADNEAIFRRVVETGQMASFYGKAFEYEEFPELGVTYWDWDLIPVKNSCNDVTGLIISLMDVTERKKAEDQLRKSNALLERRVRERTAELQDEVAERIKAEAALIQSEKRYREVFENTSDGIFLMDMVSDDRFKFVTINPSVKKMLGLKTLEVGQYIDEVFPGEFTGVLGENYKTCIESGSALSYEERLNLPAGIIFVYITLIPIQDDEGRIYRILGICRDITEQKEMAESLKRAKEEAEYANNAKSEYIANMSHELRTPLNVILSAIQLFELYMKSNPSSETHKHSKHLKSMKQNCFRLLRLVNNLIDTTKIDANFYELNLGNYDIVNIVETIILSVTDYVQNRGISLNFTANVDKKIIASDLDMIERIMLNLLSNAIKFTAANGTISVSLIDKGSSMIISVKDDGIGIPEDKQKTIFERYRQTDQLLTRKHEGSGIGLSITKSFIEVLGGTISVNSKPGLGSEFIVELPCMLISGNGHQKEIEYALHDYSIIQKISVELSDIYSI